MSRLSSSRIDFPAWVSGNLTVEQKGGDEWTCECPMCGKEKLAVNVRKKAWQCWTCKFAGRKPEILMAAVLSLDPQQMRAYISTGVLALASERIEPLLPKKGKRGVLPKAPLPPGTAPLQGLAKRYSEKRGISAENAAIFGLSSILGDGSGSIADRMITGRLLIPAFDLRKRLVYWVARATDEHDIKTANLPRHERHEAWGLSPVKQCASRSEVLVGIHAVTSGSRVIVVEGPMDAVVCGPGFVATLGASLSVEQAFLLASSGASEAVILYDPDEAGAKGAKAAYMRLSPFMPTQIAQCPVGFDPADLGRHRSLEVVDSTRTVEAVDPLLPIFWRKRGDSLRRQDWKIGGLKAHKKKV